MGVHRLSVGNTFLGCFEIWCATFRLAHTLGWALWAGHTLGWAHFDSFCALIMPRGAQRRARRRHQVEQEDEEQPQREQGLAASTVGLACVVDSNYDLVLCEQACSDLLACNVDLLVEARNNVKTLIESQTTMKLHGKAQAPLRRTLVLQANEKYDRVYFETLRAYAYVFECALMSFPRGTPKEKRGMAVAVSVEGLDRLGCKQPDTRPSWVSSFPNVAKLDLQNDMYACIHNFYMEYSGLATSPL